MHTSIKSEGGFTMIEIICAIVVLTVGLMGVALMQTKAIQGNSFASSFNEGSMVGQSWMEWLEGYVTWPNQQNRTWGGKQLPENFCTVSELDTNPDDNLPTVYQDATTGWYTMSGFLSFLDDKGFFAPRLIDDNSTLQRALTEEQIPGPACSGYSMEWRVTANMPVTNNTIVEIITTCNNSFTRNKKNTLRLILTPQL